MLSTRTTTPRRVRSVRCNARTNEFTCPQPLVPDCLVHPLDVFRDLTAAGSRLGFFTEETRDDIPADPGCYGWFLPLWLLPTHPRLPQFLTVFGSMLIQEPKPEKELDAAFAWDTVKVKLRREFDPDISEKLTSVTPVWERLQADGHARDALQHVLLQASVLTPPLYVGKTDNLRRRYNQHTAPSGRGTSTFNSRFTECARRFSLGLDVSDLLYVCIRTGREIEGRLSATSDMQQVNDLLEEVLKRLCRPPLSSR